MATKKHHKRRRSASKPKTRRRRRSSGLFGSSAALPVGLKGAVLNLAKGVAGALIISKLAPMIDKDGSKPDNRMYFGIGLSIITAAFFKQPVIAAGMAGATALQIGSKIGLLSDDELDFQYVPSTLLSQKAIASRINSNGSLMPDFINDNDGNQYQLYDDGQYRLYDGFTSVYGNNISNPGFYDGMAGFRC